jgi:dCMP deaminase
VAGETSKRPDINEYLMGIALAVRERANCLGNRVGAVLTVNDRVVSTGYNGTPDHMQNCDEGGCERCRNREKYGPGKGYDLCICVHAEQNALLAAARLGIPVEGAVLYSTMRPCFGCTKELLQGKIRGVYYLHDWTHPDPEVRSEYEKIQSRFQDGLRRMVVPDPRRDWAVSSKSPVPQESGHTIPGS